MKISGFVITGPGETGLEYGTFGRTMGEAWSRHCQFGPRGVQDKGERSIQIQRWSQRGYKPTPATMEIDQ